MKKKAIPRVLIYLALGLALSALALVASAQIADDSPEAKIRAILSADHGYPESVATVDGESIHGKELSARIVIIEQDPLWAGNTNIESIALGSLIADHLLLQETRNLGLWPSDEQVSAKIESVLSEYSQLPTDSEARIAIDTSLTAQGLDIEDLQSNQSARAVYERGLALSNLRDYLRQTLPVAERTNEEKLAQAENALVAAAWQKADLEIDIPVAPTIPTYDTKAGSIPQ